MSVFKPAAILVSLAIILFSVFALSDVKLSDALFSPGFLTRTSENDEKIVTRRANFDPELMEEGGKVGLRSSLYLLTSAPILDRQVSQISQHVRLLGPLFSKIFVRLITLPGQRPIEWVLPRNIHVDIQEVKEVYGGDSKASFDIYRRQWEDHYCQLPPPDTSYLLLLDTDKPGRIFPGGVLESIGYLHLHPEVSGVGFRTTIPGGKMYPEGVGEDGWKIFISRSVPYAQGLISYSGWRMGLYRIPLKCGKSGERVMNTRMVYLIKK